MINILSMWLIHIGPGRNAWFMFGVMIDLWTTNRLPIHGINSPLNVKISAESWYLEISTELLTSSLIGAKTLGFCSLNHPMTLLLMELELEFLSNCTTIQTRDFDLLESISLTKSVTTTSLWIGTDLSSTTLGLTNIAMENHHFSWESSL